MMRRRNDMEIIAGRFNGADGQVTAGTGFIVTRGGPGSYVIRFGDGFRLIALSLLQQQADRPSYVGVPQENWVSVVTVGGIGGGGFDPPAVWFIAVGTQR